MLIKHVINFSMDSFNKRSLEQKMAMNMSLEQKMAMNMNWFNQIPIEKKIIMSMDFDFLPNEDQISLKNILEQRQYFIQLPIFISVISIENLEKIINKDINKYVYLFNNFIYDLRLTIRISDSFKQEYFREHVKINLCNMLRILVKKENLKKYNNRSFAEFDNSVLAFQNFPDLISKEEINQWRNIDIEEERNRQNFKQNLIVASVGISIIFIIFTIVRN